MAEMVLTNISYMPHNGMYSDNYSNNTNNNNKKLGMK